MKSPSTHRRPGITAGRLALFLWIATATHVMPRLAQAQAKPDAAKAASVFDDEKADEKKPDDKKADDKKADDKKADDKKPNDKKADDKKADDEKKKADDEKKADEKQKADDEKMAKEKEQAKKATASERDSIGFTQENVAAQMTELEERMFRLSEALRGLEPENASRLRLALKFSREEQILDQMRETHKFMKDAQLSKAETEVRELVAKLEHLRNLLLAEDLDFQLKVARLRQMREALSQLDRIVKEEKRELGWSRFAIEQRKGLDRLAARRPDLEALARDQKALVADTKNAPPNGDAVKEAKAAIREREVKIRNTANALATDPLFADLQPPHLRRADAHLGDAVSLLEGTDVDAAVEAEEKALAMIGQELTRFDEQVAQSKQTIADGEFKRRQGDQSKNRAATDTLSEVSARLGDTGVALRKDLIRASGSMRTAEEGLGQTAAEPAADNQSAALEALTKSREELAQAVEKLLVELRKELQARLVAELTEMHELQAAIRETTQAQAPRVLQKSRTALIAVSGLSKKEAELGERTEHLLALVEETEFGIALPTTLRVLGREMRNIEGWLKAGDVAPRTIALEIRVEEDLLGLLQAIRRLPPGTPPPPGSPLPSDLRERERELNRLVAELKMIRMLQSRLNDDTVGVDKSRPDISELPPALRREVEALEASQDEIRESLAKIAERLENPDDNP
ncbi:DUF4175 family protein [Singulisphaera acidiphila]|uniref:Uncharacterized protein n=1 Tax=Singulisphaera acidiphila (strain ATCC BAA-1392 / DSM 18658 / VKM B-2454 / MOB10) TaxID=886293 RepID=L0DHB0_SINAD|nr:DUF4175 family protein [Singulisphaera acidiphila]AGA28203.1 hypothetical protein Sinac_3978 [Singulisphaera acidiphila DSM 18658]